MYKILNVLILSAVVGVVFGVDSPYAQCQGHNIEDLAERIKVIPCGKSRCRLSKGTNTTVEFKFKPSHDVTNLINDVSASFGQVLTLPFIGINGQSACHEVFHADTLKPAPCPLKAGLEYIYRNVFPIYEIYPDTQLRVHWSLKDGANDVICFEVPATIGKFKNKSG